MLLQCYTGVPQLDCHNLRLYFKELRKNHIYIFFVNIPQLANRLLYVNVVAFAFVLFIETVMVILGGVSLGEVLL